MSSHTHQKCWKRDFLFLTIPKNVENHHYLLFSPQYSCFSKRDKPDIPYYSQFSRHIFTKRAIWCIVQVIFIFQKVLEFFKISCFIFNDTSKEAWTAAFIARNSWTKSLWATFCSERKQRVSRFTSGKCLQNTVIWFSSKTSPDHIPQMKIRSSWKNIFLPAHQHSGDMKITIRCFRTQMGWLLADRKALGTPIATGLSKSPIDSYQRSDATTARRSAKHGT